MLSAYGVGMLLTSVIAYRLKIRRLLATGQLFGGLGALILIALGLGAGATVLLIAAFLAGVGNSLSGIAWETRYRNISGPNCFPASRPTTNSSHSLLSQSDRS